MPEMKQKVAELFTYMDSTRKALLDCAKNMNPSFARIRPHEGVWSAAENLAHLALVEHFVADMVTASIAKAREDGVPPDQSEESFMNTLDRFRVPEAVVRITARPSITPDPSKSVEESVAALERSRERLKKALIEGADVDLAAIKRPHPALHDLDMYQWALFTAQHEERHRRQMERTLDEVTELAAECAPIV